MLLAWIGIGALVGAGGAVVAQVGPWWAAVLVHYAIPYVALTVLVGRTAPGLRAAALRATCCFATFVIAYYAVVGIQYGSIPVQYAAAWLVAALTVCPVGAGAVRWAVGRSGAVPAAVFAAAGAVALADGSVGNLVRLAVGRLSPDRVGIALVVDAAAGLAVAGAIVLLGPRDRPTRAAAAGLSVPLAAIATAVGWAVHFGLGPYP